MKAINHYSVGEVQTKSNHQNKEIYIGPDNYKWLNQVKGLWQDAKISVLPDTPLDRKAADGFLYFIVNHPDGKFAVIYNDFKVNGGSFGKKNSLRIKNFISYLDQQKIPLIFLTNSIGARLMDGRKVFTPAFSVIPELAKFSERNLLLTGNIGRSLGLGAILFSMGHYRYSIKENSPINLTGPEVIKLFFGKGHNFNDISCAQKHLKNSSLVHELCEDKNDMFNKMREVLFFVLRKDHFYDLQNPVLKDIYQTPTPEDRITQLLDSICDGAHEVFSHMDSVVRCYLVRRNGHLAGVLINPPGNPNNIVNIKTLEKYQAAFQLFKSLQVPLISFLDTPGASPLNFVDSKKEIIISIRDIAEKIIQYPYPKAGFIIGRSFGGATILSLPKVFGGDEQFIVKGSQVGIMHEKIIYSLLENNERLLDQWQESKTLEPEDYQDLIDNGTVDEVIDYNKIQEKVDAFLEK